MSHELKRQYLIHIMERYKNSCRAQKTIILNEFSQVCSYSRKYAIRILNGSVVPAFKKLKRGRKPIYCIDAIHEMVRLWSLMGFPCSKKLKAALPIWIPYDVKLNKPEKLSIKNQILKISRAHLDRLLKPFKKDSTKLKGISGTVPAGKHFRNKIPIQPKDWNVTVPGIVQGDTVVHCGDSLLGKYVNSLTVVDIFTGWTEVRALWGKNSTEVIEGMKSIEKTLPFRLIQFKSDSGTEFLNHELMAYFTENRLETGEVRMVRSRPYKKDDNCYVEQKNFTHVREIFGYERLDFKELQSLMNDIYQNYWCPLQNYFMPSLKLLRKTRIGSKIKKEYDSPQTPYQRLKNVGTMTEEKEEEIKNHFNALDPFKLKKDLDQKLEEFKELLRKKMTGNSTTTGSL
jgi:hypothetical protein